MELDRRIQWMGLARQDTPSFFFFFFSATFASEARESSRERQRESTLGLSRDNRRSFVCLARLSPFLSAAGWWLLGDHTRQDKTSFLRERRWRWRRRTVLISGFQCLRGQLWRLVCERGNRLPVSGLETRCKRRCSATLEVCFERQA